jgi:hypothetical protein
MGFKDTDERAKESTRKAMPIPTMIAEMQRDMGEVVVPVVDSVLEEPMFVWDKDSPDMSVEICYHSMDDFRLPVGNEAACHSKRV